MTDREILIQMFAKIGRKMKTMRESWGPSFPDDQYELLLHGGYNGFYTEFVFNEDGSLKDIGAFE